MKIISVVGARPNFMKIAPLCHAITQYNRTSLNPIQHILVHTGQHYDDKMSKIFFDSLAIPSADINLGIGSGSHAEQVGNTMIAIEKVLALEAPDWVIVLGDVNATLACSVAAKKLNIRVCHIEAGLRSGDMSMPEEINRLVTDRISDLLLTPDTISSQNLLNEGLDKNKVIMVGNIMIDTLIKQRPLAEKLNSLSIVNENIHDGTPKKAFQGARYGLITLHRPSNVDNAVVLKALSDFFCDEVSRDMQLLWSIHPRTYYRLKEFGLLSKLIENPNIILLNPLGYRELLRLNLEAKLVLTDSGGLQEECTVIGTPCLTMRWNTERPITLTQHGGASVLVGNDIQRIREEYNRALNVTRIPFNPPLWDGNTASRCLEAILNYGLVG